MKLLILTQKVDLTDDTLSFFHSWIKTFATHYEHVTVICLSKGVYTLPDNVSILSLGKEEHVTRFTYLVRLYTYLWKERHQYDQVFVHMNVEYVVLCGWLWKMLHKKIGLWYIHRSVTWKLRIAELFADVIFSSSKESFGIPSTKVRFIKHGIDFSQFKSSIKKREKEIIISHIGRITPIKNCDVLIEAAHLLKTRYTKKIKVVFIGKPVHASDYVYERHLKDVIVNYGLEDSVEFAGGVSYNALPPYIEKSDITVNLTPPGGMDKAVLESLASMRPVFVSNTAFREVLAPYDTLFVFKERDAEDLARKISAFLDTNDMEYIITSLNRKIKQEFGLPELIKTIVTSLHETNR